MNMNDHLYHLTYQVTPHTEGLTAERIKESPGLGGCDAVVLMSLIYPQDGSYSALPLTWDGRTGGQLSAKEIWKAWVMLAHALSKDESLDDARREQCRFVFETVAAMVAAQRETP